MPDVLIDASRQAPSPGRRDAARPGHSGGVVEAAERLKLEASFADGVMPLARGWRGALDQRLGGLGLSGATGWTLLEIGRLGDHVRQIDLAERLHINSASVVRIVDALVALGFVERLFDPADRRVRRVRLLAKGREACEVVDGVVAALRAKMLEDLDDADLAASARALLRIARSLAAERRP